MGGNLGQRKASDFLPARHLGSIEQLHAVQIDLVPQPARTIIARIAGPFPDQGAHCCSCRAKATKRGANSFSNRSRDSR
jgi:hypothetical protein